jgi:hypothetical protein
MLDSMQEARAALPGQPPAAIVDLERNGKVVRRAITAAAGVHPAYRSTRRGIAAVAAHARRYTSERRC